VSLRLFGALDPGDPTVGLLDAAAARHLRARRAAVGQTIVLVLGPGCEHDATLLRIEARGARCRVGARRPPTGADPTGAAWLCVGLADPGRLDLVAEKATELGASAIAVFRARRSQSGTVPVSRVDRWRRIAIAACEQCGRTSPPSIEVGWDLDDVARLVAGASRALVFVAPREGATPSTARRGDVDTGAAVVPSRPADGTGPLVLVVGPEGGLEDEEVRRLVAAGAREASLGPRVLRFETAALAALARHAPDAAGAPAGVPAGPLE
jgi:16S rRNA (uracil1498-N3)-methyltransferase